MTRLIQEGEKEDSQGLVIGCLVLVLVVFGLIWLVCSRIGDTSDETTDRKPSDPIQEKIDAQFSLWDGSHRNLVRLVKQNLYDPDSFEHLETRTMKGSKYPTTYIVRMEYTGTNVFGGRVRHFVIAEVSVESGTVLQVLNEGLGTR